MSKPTAINSIRNLSSLSQSNLRVCPSCRRTTWYRMSSTAQSSSRQSAYETTFKKPPSAYGWRYHLDNTIQFVLWASFGSAAIHLLNVKQKYAEKERRMATKISILKDVIKRIGEGEDVDVAKELKVGKTEEEREWEDVLKSFQEEAGINPSDTSTRTEEPSAVEVQPRLIAHVQSTKDETKTSQSSSGWFWRS